jgi:hypothetical protein
MMAGSRWSDIAQSRGKLAVAILILSAVGITFISWTAIDNASATDKGETTRLVFSSVLPLLGTWVGTVLAFYFSRENLVTASETTIAAIRAGGGMTEEEQVTTAMTPFNRIAREEVADDAAAQALLLKNLYAKMQASGLSRVPIFANRRALYVIHEPDIDKYSQGQGVASAALDDQKSLATLLADPELKSAVTAFAAVAATATVAEARAALGRTADAKDLFVTTDGKADGTVLGWLTNSDLARS